MTGMLYVWEISCGDGWPFVAQAAARPVRFPTHIMKEEEEEEKKIKNVDMEVVTLPPSHSVLLDHTHNIMIISLPSL
jgi:hypothetical protein